MKSLLRVMFIFGTVLALNALIHFLIFKKYGNYFIELFKSHSDSVIYGFTIRLIQYEALIGFLILFLVSSLMLFIPKKNTKERKK